MPLSSPFLRAVGISQVIGRGTLSFHNTFHPLGDDSHLQKTCKKEAWKDSHAKRLVKQLKKYRNELFTFVNQDGVAFENNHAKRSIHPVVILRKNSYGNRSVQGADCQAVLMSVFRTLKQRNHDPIRCTINVLKCYLTTGILPPLPKFTSDN